jgi:hypothetical protein
MKKNDKRDEGFILCGPDADGGGQHCMRLSSDGAEVGVLAPFEGFSALPAGARIVEGQKVGQVVRVSSISEPIGGPPKVTSDEYRSGWDMIWNKEVGQA